MNRRELAKNGLIGAAGCLIGAEKEALAAPHNDLPFGGCEGRIVSMIQYRDKVLVALEHSVWELSTDCCGETRRTLIMRA